MANTKKTRNVVVSRPCPCHQEPVIVTAEEFRP